MAATSSPAPWSAADQQSFAFESTAKRWPIILSQAIDALYQASATTGVSSSSLIESLSKLKHDIGRDRQLEDIPQDSGASVKLYNEELARLGHPTWFSAPWLFAECYLYRFVRSLFDSSADWKDFDPFGSQKLSAFQSSGAAIEQLAQTLEQLLEQQQGSADAAANTADGLKLTFFAMAQSALWGNATDLSLLTSLTHADIQTLQAGGIGEEAQKGREKFILSGLGGLEEAWKRIEPLKQQGGGRIDIVLDNAGFELVTDLMLGQWLLQTGFASKVVFHAKAIPWFVSDVTPPDFAATIQALQDADFFSKAETVSQEEMQRRLRERSSSRTRSAQADLSDFAPGVRPNPAGARSLQYQPGGAAQRTMSPAGSRILQANDGEDRGRAVPAPAGSRSLQMDPAYFNSARQRTVSPGRPAGLPENAALSFADLSISKDEDTGRGRSAAGSRPPAMRSASGFRSVSRSAVSHKSANAATQRLAADWARLLREGRFELSVPVTTKLGESTGLAKGDFWTEASPYADMGRVAPALLAELREKSSLVIFKGDLNYRKLTADLQWPATTPFEQSLGALAGSFDLLALRTCKADVVVGLGEGVEQRVQKEDSKWRVNGKYAVVQFSARK
ncbi:unnamed protein product [Parajaminaea phylloscopi]